MTHSPATKLITTAFGLTDIGLRKENNEDSFFIDNDLQLFIIADGMGGLLKGEEASAYAAEKMTLFTKHLRNWEEQTITDDDMVVSADPVENLLIGIMEVNRALHKEFGGTSGTTLAMLYIHNNRAHIMNVGDSRVYHIRDNTIQQITHDHSMVEEEKRMGNVTREEAMTMKKNILRRAVGTKDNVTPDHYSLATYPPERFLLCSDGLSNMVNTQELLEFARLPNMQEACQKMIDLANEKGGKDNITAVLVEVSRMSPSQETKIVTGDVEDTVEI
ncbi:MAG: protein phosphatase 2C domain-containing protein [Deltaproteobacteria bacterium]|nr:protein phosphatase 2C domain-containing protein [Deltaproteobacteria bacterium]